MEALLNKSSWEIVLILCVFTILTSFLIFLIVFLTKKLGLRTKWFSLSQSSSKIRRLDHTMCPMYQDIGVIVRLSKEATKLIAKKWYKEKTREQLEVVESLFGVITNKFKTLSRNYGNEHNNTKIIKILNLSVQIVLYELKYSLKLTIINNNFPDDGWDNFKKGHYKILSSGVVNRLIEDCTPFISDNVSDLEEEVFKPFLIELERQIHKSFDESKRLSIKFKNDIDNIEENFSKNFVAIVKRKGGKDEKNGNTYNNNFN